jgi:hypothetical protein
MQVLASFTPFCRSQPIGGSMTRKLAVAAAIAAVALTGGCAPSSRIAPTGGESPADTACDASYLAGYDRSLLCGRVIDERTGAGVPGGDVEFVREDGRSMVGTVDEDGTFSINVPAGRGTLTIGWSCRASVRTVRKLTVLPARGVWRTFPVTVTPRDTLCRLETNDRTDTTAGAVARWMDRGPCLELAIGPWRPRLVASETPTGRVRLDSLAEHRPRAGSSQPLHFDPPSGEQWRSSGWMPLRGDSIQLFWSKDFSGVTLTLGVSADSLAGRGIWISDVILTDADGFLDQSVYPNGAASARRIECP